MFDDKEITEKSLDNLMTYIFGQPPEENPFTYQPSDRNALTALQIVFEGTDWADTWLASFEEQPEDLREHLIKAYELNYIDEGFLQEFSEKDMDGFHEYMTKYN